METASFFVSPTGGTKKIEWTAGQVFEKGEISVLLKMGIISGIYSIEQNAYVNCHCEWSRRCFITGFTNDISTLRMRNCTLKAKKSCHLHDSFSFKN
ncbi:MAG: hypothetical protein ACOH1X_11210 [Kaistella sp.]